MMERHGQRSYYAHAGADCELHLRPVFKFKTSEAFVSLEILLLKLLLVKKKYQDSLNWRL
jgi:hypothetical protein